MIVQQFFSGQKKLGVLGAGQLGKMLLPVTQSWDIYTKMLDPDPQAPCHAFCNEFVQGSLTDYDTVYQFGKDCSVLTIEIEHVNTDALLKLEEEGVVVHPKPKILKLIQDKGLQKEFYQTHGFQTAPFTLYKNKHEVLDALARNDIQIPFVQKSRTAGYDGKGVIVVNEEKDLAHLLDTPCLVEKAIDIQTEVAVIVARNQNGELAVYDATMMEFHEGANMLDLLLYPAPLSSSITELAKETASRLIEKMDLCGILAVEFLLDKNNQLWLNEVAPRPHNSGHQTIEASYTSQYEQHIRAILNLPLGHTGCVKPAAMVNILGEAGYAGEVNYTGIETCLDQPGIYIHIYGKKITKPFRKMGHATILHDTLSEAKNKALWVRQTIKVTSL